MRIKSTFYLKTLGYFIVLLCISSCQSPQQNKALKTLTLSDEITINEIQQSLKSKEYNIQELTKFYLDRIDSLSFNGPELNAVITVNPDAMKIAKELDEELSSGTIRGPLHGIPVLLKDNINTGDKMATTAGANAMKNSFAEKDSPIAEQLRKAGAIIIGKANLSEWANFHSTTSSSGWSAIGGQTKNPYILTTNPCGSSSGSAVAVAANLCVVAIGSETNGSIMCPANNNGIVGIKPTVGLVSRTGVIPISFSQDTAGPMARTVTDAALCLNSLTAIDSLDSKTLQADRKAQNDYTTFLNANGIKGKRIGYWTSPEKENKQVEAIMKETVEFFKNEGATIIELDEIIDPAANQHSFQVLLYEFKDGLNQYFNDLGGNAQVNNLEQLIDKTFADSIEMEYHDHELLKQAQAKGDLNTEEYKEALKTMYRLSRDEGIDKVMNANNLDAIIAPAGGPAWKTDLINGDDFEISSSSPAAIAGYPNIAVPMGEINGLPVGLAIFGKAWSEPTLLEIAYSFEQGTQKRFTPKYIEE